jgi:hypothetical protein
MARPTAYGSQREIMKINTSRGYEDWPESMVPRSEKATPRAWTPSFPCRGEPHQETKEKSDSRGLATDLVPLVAASTPLRSGQ